MPYTQEHKQRSRAKILEAASRLFTARGFERVTIDAVMAEAGLTRGAFYAHFRNKGELYAHAIRTSAKEGFSRRVGAGADNKKEFLHRLAKSYLSHMHVEGDEWPCPLGFLVSDVVNSDAAGRRAYTEALRGLSSTIATHLSGRNKKKREQRALAITALLIGGVAIGRAVTDKSTVDALLTSCLEEVTQLIERT